MSTHRRPLVAITATIVLVAIQAILDPTGLLALVGWSGAQPAFDRGLWPFAPYVVFLPVMLAVVWWVALRAGNRFWTLFVGNVLAVLLAQAAALLAMTGDLANSAWGAGYVTAKAIPAALIIAAFTRWFGGFVKVDRHLPGAVVAPSILFAAVAPLVAGQWWTAVVFAPGVPVAQARARMGIRADRHRTASGDRSSVRALDAGARTRRAWRLAWRPRRRRNFRGATGRDRRVHRRHAELRSVAGHGDLCWPRRRPRVRRRARLGRRGWRCGRGSRRRAPGGSRRSERA